MQTTDIGDVNMPRKRGSRPYINRPPQGLPAGAPTEAALAEFGAKLQKLLVDKNWSQSDLARHAAKFMPDKKFHRDNVSQYVRGLSFPYPVRFNAICRALGVDPQELRPAAGLPSSSDKAPPLDIRALSDGSVYLRVNQAVKLETAMKVLSLLGQSFDADKSK